MPLFLPNRPARSRQVKKLRGVRPSRRIEVAAYEDLVRLLEPIQADIAAMAPDLIETEDAVFAMEALTELQEKWDRVLGNSVAGIAGKWSRAISEYDRLALERSIGKAFGVENAYILDEENVAQAIFDMQDEMREIIKTIPQKYIEQVQKTVFQNFFNVPLPENRTLMEEIVELSGISYERARLIARDQTNKYTSVITEARQTDLGIEEYVWRTAEDSRVVGTPGGKYPKASNPAMHGNHYKRNGKVFRWDNPPEDGPPGWAIQCRCYAEPIIDMEKVKLVQA